MNNKDKKGSKKFNFVSAEELDNTITLNQEAIKNDFSQGEKEVVSKNKKKRRKRKKGKAGIPQREFIEQKEKEPEKTSLSKQGDMTPRENNIRESDLKVSIPEKTVENKFSEFPDFEEKQKEKDLEPTVFEKNIEEEYSVPFIPEKKVEENNLKPEVSEKDIDEYSVPFISERKVEENNLKPEVSEKDIDEYSVPFIPEKKVEENDFKPEVSEKDIEEYSVPFIPEKKVEENDLKPEVSEKDIEEEYPESSVSEVKIEESDLKPVVPEKNIKEEQPKSPVSEDKVAEKKSETTVKEKEVPERLVDEASENIKKKSSKLKMYFSFEERIITLIFSVILLFVISCILILEAVDFGKKETIAYDEIGNVGYKVCLKDNDYYHNNCLDEGMEYVSSLTDKVEVNFDYNVGFSTEIDYDLSYHVVGITKVYNKNDKNKILYQNEDSLVEKTDISKLADSIEVEENVTIDYMTFQEKVLNYMSQYSEDASATLEVILYLDEPTETRKISSVTIPLGSETYAITKSELSNTNKSVEIVNETWDVYHSVCVSIGIVLLLVDLLILFKTTKFVLNATAKRDKFRAKLGQILREYDRMIVVARDGFISTGDKKIVKVANFNELLDVSKALQKPIIYSRVNNVKSEFIVEDIDTLYKYVMKESDFAK